MGGGVNTRRYTLYMVSASFKLYFYGVNGQ